jgi:hypothetical protein
VLPAGPAASTTEFEDDVDGEPPGGALPTGPVASTIEFEDDIDGGVPGGHYQRVWQRPPPCFEDYIDGEPPGGAVDKSDSVDPQG